MVAEVGSDRYYCKRDKNGTPIRATEWMFSSLASHLNIPVPDFAPIRNPENNEVLFGSRGTWGTASEMEVRTFLTTPVIFDKAVSATPPWLTSYLSRLYVYDLFAANPDRQMANFLLVPASGSRQLLAFDFASSDLNQLATPHFSIANSQTLFVGKHLRNLQGFDPKAAIEMCDWIDAVPASVVMGFLSSMPDDWMTEDEKGKISDHWSNGAVGERLVALRRGIRDESLL